MHDHVNAPVKETPLLVEAANPVRAEVVAPAAFVFDKEKQF
jgi:hypothetical protein